MKDYRPRGVIPIAASATGLTAARKSCPVKPRGAILGALLAAIVASPIPVWANELIQTRLQLQEKYRQQLTDLAAWCESQNLPELAARTRHWFHPPDPHKLYMPVLPRETNSLAPPSGVTGPAAEWHARFARLRRDQAAALFELARRAIRAQRAALAFECLLDALRENPDHETIRRILGFQPYQGQWRTAYEVRRLRSGDIWHEKFGWIPAAHRNRYENGLRPINDRWLPAEEVEQLRSDIHNGWDIETEHYLIRTNAGLEAGIVMANELERLFSVWRQLFVRFYANEAQIMSLFDARSRTGLPTVAKKRVVYFRSQEDFRNGLRAALPAVDRVNITGVYFGQNRTAYFFVSDPPDWTTVYHEATHQLFAEARPTSSQAGLRQNFWILEAVALYMETLRTQGDYHVLGGWEAQRVKDACYRLVHRNEYLPLEKLVSLGMEQFQTYPDLGMLYTQCAGLAQFFMHHDYGRYRDGLIAYLNAVYSGRDDLLSLSRYTGKQLAELDNEYHHYMASGPELSPIHSAAR